LLLTPPSISLLYFNFVVDIDIITVQLLTWILRRSKKTHTWQFTKMSWDTGTGGSWNEGGVATTLNKPAAGGGDWNGGGANSFNKPASAGHGDNAYGAGQASGYGGDGEGGDGFGGAEGGRPSGACFNCGEEGYVRLKFPVTNDALAKSSSVTRRRTALTRLSLDHASIVAKKGKLNFVLGF
jgi:hypothetical protein